MIDQTVWYYRELDLPPLPDYLQDRLRALSDQYLLEKPEVVYTKENRNEYDYINYMLSADTPLNETLKIPGVEAIYHDLTPEFLSWYRENISLHAMMPRFAVFNPRPGTRVNFLPAHCDMRRNYALNYVFEPGGNNVTTSFFQEEGEPIIRDCQVRAGRSVSEEIKKKLNKLATIKIPNNTWHIIRTDVIHRVEYITSSRIRITSDPDQAEVDRLKQFVIRTID